MSTDSKFACLTYYAIGNEFAQYVISEDQLRNQLEFLSQEGFVVEGFEELEFRLRANSIFPGKYVLLTAVAGHKMHSESRICSKAAGATLHSFRLGTELWENLVTSGPRKCVSSDEEASRSERTALHTGT